MPWSSKPGCSFFYHCSRCWIVAGPDGRSPRDRASTLTKGHLQALLAAKYHTSFGPDLPIVECERLGLVRVHTSSDGLDSSYVLTEAGRAAIAAMKP